MQNERLIGAATLFDFDNKELPNTYTVAEVSITRVDDKPGLGIATVLLKQARSYAYAAGKTHCYTSFEPSNDASRKIINKVFKVKNIAAGKTSLTDRFYRLHNVNPDDYIELENAMKIYCGEEPRIEEEIVDVATKRKAKIIKLGKRATKESLRVDKKQKK